MRSETDHALGRHVLGHHPDLDDEVCREVLRPDLPRFSCHSRIRAFSSCPMMIRASEPPMKLRRSAESAKNLLHVAICLSSYQFVVLETVSR
jgi:hypothetical protein